MIDALRNHIQHRINIDAEELTSVLSFFRPIHLAKKENLLLERFVRLIFLW